MPRRIMTGLSEDETQREYNLSSFNIRLYNIAFYRSSLSVSSNNINNNSTGFKCNMCVTYRFDFMIYTVYIVAPIQVEKNARGIS